MRQRGQALPLMGVVVALAALVVLGLGRVGSVVVARAQAQTAADAAALAGAVEGRVAAEGLAAANGGRLVSWAAAGREVEVVADVRGERARARARRV
ncbi:MAG: pilus assembly protein TadG-related protein [Acidimicrobiales bacterium]